MPVSRRRMLGMMGAGLASAGFAGASSFEVIRRGDTAAATGNDVLVVSEADPLATPYVYRNASGVQYQLPTATPTPSPTATPSPTPSPTATPPSARRTTGPRPGWDSNLLKQVLRSGPDAKPYVALTIDDGWSDRDGVLEILKAKGVQLTLFLAGRPIIGDYGFVARALDAGQEIANHTWDHYDLTNKTRDYIQKDLADFEALVKTQVGSASTQPYMRPSGGALNQTVIDAAADAGYRPVLWSGSVGDGSTATTADQMVANGLAAAKPGAIVLMHFGPRALIALPRLIDGMRARGLEPVSLSRLFQVDPGVVELAGKRGRS